MCSSLLKGLLLGTYCYWELVLGLFFCVAISLRAFSCQFVFVVDFCGVVYLCSSLFRNLLWFFFLEKIHLLVFWVIFSWGIWVHRIYGWCGLVFPLYFFCSCSFSFFRYAVFYCSAMPINSFDSESIFKNALLLNNQISRL